MAIILVIEDQTDLLEDVMELLQFEGYEVWGASDGRSGVQIAHDRLPDLIICDVMMPELDGFGVLFELRCEPMTTTIPFIFLTARTAREDLRRGMQLGADDYLTKPFTQNELLSAVNVMLAKRQALEKESEARLDEMRQSLLSTLPHEFRTPLTSILGYGQLLLDFDTLESSQVQNMIKVIIQAGNRLYRLIENYLLYAQIEIIRTDPDRINKLRGVRVVNPEREIIRTAGDKAVEVERAGDLTIHIENVPFIMSDEGLKKIVEELVDNAFKFSEYGSPVEILGKVSGNAYSLCVSDQGHGMTANQIRKVGAFTQFERKLYEQQGMGLGLVLSKRIVELYGGHLEIESRLHEGTQLYVEFLL